MNFIPTYYISLGSSSHIFSTYGSKWILNFPVALSSLGQTLISSSMHFFVGLCEPPQHLYLFFRNFLILSENWGFSFFLTIFNHPCCIWEWEFDELMWERFSSQSAWLMKSLDRIIISLDITFFKCKQSGLYYFYRIHVLSKQSCIFRNSFFYFYFKNNLVCQQI